MTVFRPDPSPETTCLDGSLEMRDSGGVTWAVIRAGVLGDISGSDASSSEWIEIRADGITDRWHRLFRGVVGFDTSTLPGDISISSATLSLYGIDKRDHLGIIPNINIYSTSLTDNIDISPTNEDLLTNYRAFGSTAFSTAISYAGWNTPGWNDFVLNSAGRTHINRTGVTNFGIRNANYDVANFAPSWTVSEESSLFWWAADFSAELAPKLTVTYTTSTMTAGNFAVVETRLHYVGRDSVERYIFGPIIGDAVNDPGNVAVVEDRLHYVGASYTKERYWLGTEIGAASNANGNIAVVENRLQYTAGSKERYIKGIPV